MDTRCAYTHPLLASGNCPWCGAAFGGASQDGVKGEKPSWNVAAMLAALDAPEAGDRLRVVELLGNAPDPHPLLPVLRKALRDPDRKVRTWAVHAATDIGRRVRPPPATESERSAEDSLIDGLLLVGYHFARVRELRDGARRGVRLGPARLVTAWRLRSRRRRLARYLLAVVAGAPALAGSLATHFLLAGLDDAPERDAFRQLWVRQVEAHPGDTEVLGSAAEFVGTFDHPVERQFLRRAQALEPGRAEWHRRLGQSFLADSHAADPYDGGPPPEAARDAARAALAELVRALDCPLEARERRALLQELAEAAWRAGEAEWARAFGIELLAVAGDDAEAAHHAHGVLGLAALRRGDVPAARDHLERSVGEQDVGVLGPDTTLARELLAAGQREAVVRFLRQCARVSTSGAGYAEQWAEQVESGREPNILFRMDARY